MAITRRNFVRQRLQPPALVRTGPASACEVIDLSESGAGLLSAEPLPQGESIRLQIPIPTHRATAETSRLAEATGEIVWAAESGRAGMRFLDIPEDSRLLIREWVRYSESAVPSQTSEETQPAAMPAESSPPVAQFAHPWTIVAAAVIIGVAGGIWLARRDNQPETKKNVSVPAVQQLPTKSVVPAPPQTIVAAPEAPPAEPRADQPVSPIKPRVDQPASPIKPMMLPSVEAIRFFHQPGLTKIEIELGSSILRRTGRLHKPERIYFDVQDSHREMGIVRRLQEQKVAGINDGVLTGVRVAPLRSGDVRVVLDLNRSCDYLYRLVAQPASHLIVELRARAEGAPAPRQ